MAKFVQLDKDDVVVEGIVVANDIALDEWAGIEYLNSIYDSGFKWKQTYQDGRRKNYAGIGYSYDKTRDAFIPPQPYPSWLLDEDTCRWDAPTPMPDDGKRYGWDEDTTNWIIVE
jgi:hypothetical protein